MFLEHDVVVLMEDLPEEGLMEGSIGTIVHVYGNAAAYEVEFMGADVHTSTLVTLTADQIRPR